MTGKSPRQNLYTTQDGNRFYFHLHGQPSHQLIAPFPVHSDYDLDAARRARAWFKRQAKKNNFLIRWE